MDTIITIDKDRHITLFNRAAEEMFQCRTEQVIGRCLDEFLGDRFGRFVSAYFDNGNRSAKIKEPLWVPEGLMARGSDAREFPVEATLSPLEMNEQQSLTLILRDVNRRRQAEAAIEALQSQNQYLREEIRGEHNVKQIIGHSFASESFSRQIRSIDR